MSDVVSISVKNHVAYVKLNRADKYNALNMEMFEAIVAAGRSVSKDSSVRAVVLHGEGKGFCSGLDIASLMAEGDITTGKGFKLFNKPEGSPANYAQLVGYVWKQVPVPVIAAIHGVAYGGGFQLALAADIRLATRDARFSIMEIKWGLVPDMSGTQTLRDLVRLDVAKELTFTGRVVEAQEAADLGLITKICEQPLEAAADMAQQIANKSPDAIAAGKRLLEEAWHGSSVEGLDLEAHLQKGLLGQANQIEAVMSTFEDRSPEYKDRN